jgi:hypothetical protein
MDTTATATPAAEINTGRLVLQLRLVGIRLMKDDEGGLVFNPELPETDAEARAWLAARPETALAFQATFDVEAAKSDAENAPDVAATRGQHDATLRTGMYL